MKITHDNLHDFIRGAAILGTGGGGDPYIGRLMLDQQLRQGADITILDPDDIPDDMFAATVFSMGAPTVFVEKIPSGPATVVAASDHAISSAVTRRSLARIPSRAGSAAVPRLSAAAANERKRRSTSVSAASALGAAGPRRCTMTASMSRRRAINQVASSGS